VMRAAKEFDLLAERADAGGPDISEAGEDTAAKLRTRARSLRARLN